MENEKETKNAEKNQNEELRCIATDSIEINEKTSESDSALKKQCKWFREWIHDHKTELIIICSGITIVTIAGALYQSKHGTGVACVDIKKTDALIGNMTSAASREGGRISTTIENVGKATTLEACSENLNSIAAAPCVVSEHCRTLHKGWHASDEKIASAAEHGFELSSGQTWVKSYPRNALIA